MHAEKSLQHMPSEANKEHHGMDFFLAFIAMFLEFIAVKFGNNSLAWATAALFWISISIYTRNWFKLRKWATRVVSAAAILVGTYFLTTIRLGQDEVLPLIDQRANMVLESGVIGGAHPDYVHVVLRNVGRLRVESGNLHTLEKTKTGERVNFGLSALIGVHPRTILKLDPHDPNRILPPLDLEQEDGLFATPVRGNVEFHFAGENSIPPSEEASFDVDFLKALASSRADLRPNKFTVYVIIDARYADAYGRLRSQGCLWYLPPDFKIPFKCQGHSNMWTDLEFPK
jgi:hypothetical protein